MPPPLPDAQRGLAASLQARLRQRAHVLRPPRSGGFLARHGKGQAFVSPAPAMVITPFSDRREEEGEEKEEGRGARPDSPGNPLPCHR